MERRQRPTAGRAGLFGVLALATAALAAIAAGCGGSSTTQPATAATTAATSTASASTAAATSAQATTGAETTAATTPAAKPFDVLKVAFTTDLDSMDPAIGYSLASWDVGWYVYLPLLTYQHAAGSDGTILIPALAASMPEISADGTDYKFTLRPGLKYSDGTPLKASDFAYSIKRLFIMDSPGVGYYTDIVGADQFAKTKKGDIPGIVTDDAAGTVEFKLAKPRGDFLNIVALQFSVPVPAGTPQQDLEAKKPIPSTGPYSIQSYQPNQELVVVRNPSYQAIPGIPSGNPDTMDFTILQDDGVALQKTINGETDFDYRDAPVDRLAELQQKYPDQFKVEPQQYTSYFFMNTQVSPFNNLKVRQAINDAVDRTAIVRLYGGLAIPTENVLPPGLPSYQKLDLYPHDQAKAAQLIKDAGAQGAQVTVWTPNASPYKEVAAYLADVLGKIGMKASVKPLDFSVYFTAVGDQKTKPQIGIGLWAADYPNPIAWLDPTFNGANITQKGNTNLSRANVPAVNSLIDKLKPEPTLTDAINQQWAQVDRLVMENALWAPFVNPVKTFFLGQDLDPGCYVFNPIYLVDFGLLCKKG